MNNNRRQGDELNKATSDAISAAFVGFFAFIILATLFGLWLKFFWWGWVLSAC